MVTGPYNNFILWLDSVWTTAECRWAGHKSTASPRAGAGLGPTAGRCCAACPALLQPGSQPSPPPRPLLRSLPRPQPPPRSPLHWSSAWQCWVVSLTLFEVQLAAAGRTGTVWEGSVAAGRWVPVPTQHFYATRPMVLSSDISYFEYLATSIQSNHWNRQLPLTLPDIMVSNFRIDPLSLCTDTLVDAWVSGVSSAACRGLNTDIFLRSTFVPCQVVIETA